ncbi:MAG: MXAN_6640 family putative metalloprotease [Candidatus Brocadiia bacterium]
MRCRRRSKHLLLAFLAIAIALFSLSLPKGHDETEKGAKRADIPRNATALTLVAARNDDSRPRLAPGAELQPVLSSRVTGSPHQAGSIPREQADNHRGMSRKEVSDEVAEIAAQLESLSLGNVKLENCLSDLAIRCRMFYAELPARARRIADQILLRPTTNPDYFEGVNIAYPQGTTELTLDKGGFRVHYIATGAQAATAEYAAKTSDVMPVIRAAINETMSFVAPPGDGIEGGGQDLYDVYISSLPSGIAGFCSASGKTGEAWSSYIVIDNGLSLQDSSRVTSLSTTLAHEYFHSCQYAYDVSERTWWKEATATWAQDKVFPDVKDYVLLVSERFAKPQTPLDSTVGNNEYASVLFAKFLEEYNQNNDVIRICWEKMAANREDLVPENTLPAIKDALASIGSSFELLFPIYGVWLYRKGYFADSTFYPDCATNGRYSSYPVALTSDGLSAGNLGHLSFHILEFAADASSNLLSVAFDGADGFPFSVAVLSVGTTTSSDSLTSVMLNGAQSGQLTLGDMRTKYSRICVVVANTSPYAGGASYGLSVAAALPGTFAFDRSAITLTGSEGSDSPSGSLGLSNTGEGILFWSSTSDSSWLKVVPASGSIAPFSQGTLSVTAEVTGLLPSNSPFLGKLTFTSTNASNSPQQIQVTLILLYSAPYLRCDKTELSFIALQGKSPPPEQKVVLKNEGDGPLHWNADPTMNWMRAAPSGGTLGKQETVEISVTTLSNSLPTSPNPYTGVIILSSKEAANSPLSLTVNLIVLPPNAVAPVLDTWGHVVLYEPFQWYDIAVPELDITGYFSDADNGSAAFYMPIEMSFFGRKLVREDLFYISTNGVFSFSPPGISSPENLLLPTVSLPSDLVAAFWTDFDLNVSGNVYARAFETEGVRTHFIVQFDGLFRKDGTGPFSMQIVFQSGGDIILRYNSDFRLASRGTIGLQNASGSDGLSVSFDAPAGFPTAGTSLRVTTRGQLPVLTTMPRASYVSVAAEGYAQATISLVNIGSGEMVWTLESDSPFATPAVLSGSGNSEIPVTFSAIGLAAGQYPVRVTGIAGNGVEWLGESRFVLNVYGGAPTTISLPLVAGWNAVPVCLIPRSRLSLRDFMAMARNSDGAPIAVKSERYVGSGRTDYDSGAGEEIEMQAGQAILLLCSEAGTLSLTGDPILQYLVFCDAGDSLIAVPSPYEDDISGLWPCLPTSPGLFISPWEDGFHRQFVRGSGTDAGSGRNGVVHIRASLPFYVSLSLH